MADTLVIQERVRNTIRAGESHFREFKSALDGLSNAKRPRSVRSICIDIAETLVAFTNADGGELIVGVEDDGHVSGVPLAEDAIRELLRAPATHVKVASTPLPLTAADVLNLDDRTLLYFAVDKGIAEIYQTSDGKCLRRRDLSSVPESPTRIVFDRQEMRSREHDRMFVDGATVADLDLSAISAVARATFAITAERYLQQSGVAEFVGAVLRLRAAALVTYGKNIEQWYPYSRLRILRVSGSELKVGAAYNVISDLTIRGSVIHLLDAGWIALREAIALRTDVADDARFARRLVYPEWACREALVNALVHRDYTVHAGIDAFIFSDRLELRSPGALLSTITVETLATQSGAHESRNALIARLLRDHGVVQELGEGVRRIYALMAESELAAPNFVTDATSFTVVLRNTSMFSESERRWLQQFPSGLNLPQKRIIIAGLDGRELSRSDILRALNTSDRAVYDDQVTALRQAGILREIRTKRSVREVAAQRGVDRGDIGRFIVKPLATGEIAPTKGEFVPFSETRTIFVGNVSHLSRLELRNALKSYGKITRLVFPVDRRLGRHRGFAFVEYESEQSAEEVIAAERLDVGGIAVIVERFRPAAMPVLTGARNRRAT